MGDPRTLSMMVAPALLLAGCLGDECFDEVFPATSAVYDLETDCPDGGELRSGRIQLANPQREDEIDWSFELTILEGPFPDLTVQDAPGCDGRRATPPTVRWLTFRFDENPNAITPQPMYCRVDPATDLGREVACADWDDPLRSCRLRLEPAP